MPVPYADFQKINEGVSALILEKVRWPIGLVCPRCANPRITKFTMMSKTGNSRGRYECQQCRYQYSVTVGTLFHGSHLSLEKWFLAIWLCSDEEMQPSVRKVQAFLQIPYKTAWTIVKRINDAKEEEKPFGNSGPAPQESIPNQKHRPLSGQASVGVISLRLQNILGSPRLFLRS
jgi:transposase-like protein